LGVLNTAKQTPEDVGKTKDIRDFLKIEREALKRKNGGGDERVRDI